MLVEPDHDRSQLSDRASEQVLQLIPQQAFRFGTRSSTLHIEAFLGQAEHPPRIGQHLVENSTVQEPREAVRSLPCGTIAPKTPIGPRRQTAQLTGNLVMMDMPLVSGDRAARCRRLSAWHTSSRP